MVITDQYPHSLFVPDTTGATYTDGQWTDEQTSWSLLSVCRWESSGASTESTVEGSVSTYLSGMVYAPSSCAKLADGTPFVILENVDSEYLTEAQLQSEVESGNRVAFGAVRNCEKNAFHVRIWS